MPLTVETGNVTSAMCCELTTACQSRCNTDYGGKHDDFDRYDETTSQQHTTIKIQPHSYRRSWCGVLSRARTNTSFEMRRLLILAIVFVYHVYAQTTVAPLPTSPVPTSTLRAPPPSSPPPTVGTVSNCVCSFADSRIDVFTLAYTTGKLDGVRD
jgi:hypothetical protein